MAPHAHIRSLPPTGGACPLGAARRGHDMFPRFYFVVAALALSLFSYHQYRGNGLFDDTSTSHSRGLAARSTFHK